MIAVLLITNISWLDFA